MNRTPPPIGVTGTIEKGDHLGWFIRVVDDGENTGGYLILQWHGDKGFDDWVLDEEAVAEWFDDVTVQWDSTNPDTGQLT